MECAKTMRTTKDDQESTKHYELVIIPKCKTLSTYGLCKSILNHSFKDILKAKAEFYQKKKIPKKTIFVLDNAPDHPSEQKRKSSNVRCETMILPPKCTHCSRWFKMPSKKESRSIQTTWALFLMQHKVGPLNLKEVVCLLAQSENSVSSNLIQSSGKKLWPSKTE